MTIINNNRHNDSNDDDKLLISNFVEHVLLSMEEKQHQDDDSNSNNKDDDEKERRIIRKAIEELIECKMGKDNELLLLSSLITDDNILTTNKYKQLSNIVKQVRNQVINERRKDDDSNHDKSTRLIKRSNNDDSNNQKPVSFSLLDQFQHNKPFVERVAIDQIEELVAATSSSFDNNKEDELIDLLMKVDHIDDVSYSWKDVIDTALYGGLIRATKQKTKTIIEKYVTLEMKWFKQCCSNNDSSCGQYVSIKFDLCLNIVRAIQHYQSNYYYNSNQDHHLNSSLLFLKQKEKEELIFYMVQVWYEMWIVNILPNSIYNTLHDPENDHETMVKYIWGKLLMVRKDEEGNNAPSLVCKYLAIIDPYTEWFHLWIKQIQPYRIVHLLQTDDCNIFLEYILKTTCLRGNKQNEAQEATTEKLRIPSLLLLDNNSSSSSKIAITANKLQTELLIQSLSILQSIIVTTRVSCFPWKILLSLLAKEATTETTTTTAIAPNLNHLQILLEPFVSTLELLGFTTNTQIVDEDDGINNDYDMDVDNNNNTNGINNNDKLALICYESIETVLDGCNSLLAPPPPPSSKSSNNVVSTTSTTTIREQLYEWIFVKRMIMSNK